MADHMKENIQPLRLYIEYNRNSTGGELLEPEERWSSREDTNVEVEFIQLYREKPKHVFFVDSIELPDERMFKMDKLFLAVVRYSTGDTFGRTNGEYHIVGIAPTAKVAQAMLDEATKPSKPGDYSHYKPWEGYFERLENTEIHELSVV